MTTAVVGAESKGELFDDWERIYRAMFRSREFDRLALALQRQGAIDGYAEGRGQEATNIGAIADLTSADMVFPSPRDPGVALERGVTPVELYRWYKGMDYCPYDWRKVGYYAHPIPVGTQVGHAVGWAWANKLRGTPAVAVVFFGDGASSQGEVHEAMNYAGVFDVPLVMVLVNNGWAISTPTKRQTAAPELFVRAAGYGVRGVRVDGNDVIEVRGAVKQAVDQARSGEGPTLVESVTYRMSGHTNSDDPKIYRDPLEYGEWEERDPIVRFRAFLHEHAADAEEKISEIEADVRRRLDESVDEWQKEIGQA